MFLRSFQFQLRTLRIAGTHVKAHFQFKVQACAGAVHGGSSASRHGLAHGAVKVCAANYHAAGAAMVGNGQPLEVGCERVVGPRNAAHVACMVDGCVKVRVVVNAHWQAVLHFSLCNQAGLHGFLYIGGRIGAEQGKQGMAQGPPDFRPRGHEGVQAPALASCFQRSGVFAV